MSLSLVDSFRLTITAPPGLIVSDMGFTDTSASQVFVISGGSGAGELMGSVTGEGDVTLGGFTSASHDFTGLVLPGAVGPMYISQTTFSFTFGVPFIFAIEDHATFRGLAGGSSPQTSDVDLVFSAAGTLSVFDSNGNPLPNAVVSTVVPEPSSLALFFLLAVSLGLARAAGKMLRILL